MAEKKGRQTLASRGPRFPSSKFIVPKMASHLVHRTRLMDELDRGEQARLTLVVGSPGAGKTVLLADWLSTHPTRTSAWLTCDAADDDPVRFAAGLVEAARRGAGQPDLGEDAREWLSVDRQVSADVVAALADDLERFGSPQVLIVDDFHLTGAAGADVLRLLLDYQPPGLQVVVATRLEPPLRLHRIRTNAALVEVRDRDLSFSVDETRQFLSGFGIGLSEEELEIVQRRSEGWVAGLQMAALSIHHAPDTRDVADRVELAGHTVAGYFLDEVLYRQPAPVVEFMLATSILDDLSVSACTAVNGPDAGALLQQVHRDHLFLTVLDEDAGIYRYHQLIKEVLRAELHARDPQAEQRYHERAASYLVDTGRVGLAARHLLEARDPGSAFRVLSEGLLVDFASNATPGSALGDVRPDDFAGAPEVLVPLAAELLLRGGFESGARAFALAQMTAIDPGLHPELALRLDVVGAAYHSFIGEPSEALAYRERALLMADTSVGVDDWRVGLDGVSMYDYLYIGDFAQALQLAEAVATAEITPPAGRHVLCPGIQSQIAWAQGDLTEAEDWASQALASAARLGFDRHYFAFNSLRTKALLELERRDLDAASKQNEHILSMSIGGRPRFDYLAQLDRARIWAAGGNREEALTSLPAARAALRSDRSILLAQADELEAHIRIALGDRVGAATIALRLPDHRRPIVSAIIALSEENTAAAEAFLQAAPAEPPTRRAGLELQLLRAELALIKRSHQAPRLVREALEALAPHRFIQTVLDTAPRLVEHLVSESESYPSSEYLLVLVRSALEARQLGATGPRNNRLPDPLTEAELRVLKRLSQRLTYADIAADLHLSLNTVKTHLRHSYMKLGVTSRSAAIRRAASLGFI